MINPKLVALMYKLMQSDADKKAIAHLDFEPDEEEHDNA